MKKISEQLTLFQSPKQTSSVGGFLVRLLVLLEKGQDSIQRIHEALYSLKYAESHRLREPRIFSLRMSKDCSITTTEELLRSSSLVWTNWGMTSNGKCVTAKITEYPNTENGCSLSQILEDTPDQKYFLSDKQVSKMIQRTEEHEKKGNGWKTGILSPAQPLMPTTHQDQTEKEPSLTIFPLPNTEKTKK